MSQLEKVTENYEDFISLKVLQNLKKIPKTQKQTTKKHNIYKKKGKKLTGKFLFY